MAFAQIAFLFSIAAARAAEVDEAPEPGCLLQNQFVNDKFQSSEDDAASHSFLQAKERSRTELSALESERRVSAARRQEYQAHAKHLRMTLALLNTNSNRSKDLSLFQATEGEGDFEDLGTGCCSNRNPATSPYKGAQNGLDACKAKCQSMDNCGYIEYGWKGNKADGTTNWCFVVPKGTDCDTLADGPSDCGGGGGDNGVHTYMLLESIPEQCQTGSLPPNQFVTTGWISIPGLKGTSPENVFITHGGIFNGRYVNGGGKAPEVVRRKKGTNNQWFLAIHDDKFAKVILITVQISGGEVQVHNTDARYKEMKPDDAVAAFSNADSLLNLWNTGVGQGRAESDGAAGYGIKGLGVKSCLTSEEAIKAGAAMDTLVTDFIDAQSGAEDACHSQLLEARHQLNQLHELVIDLAREVNSTEEQIMVYDKMLEQKLREMTQLTKWKDDELDKCEIARQKAVQMFGKLKGELDEMHSIANPSVAMDVKTGKLHAVSLAQEASVNRHLTIAVDSTGEEDVGAHHLSPAHHLKPSSHHASHASRPDKESADISMVSGLIAETKKASEAYKNCIGPDNSHMSLALLSEGKPKTNEECEAEKENLEKTYVKAYVELSRMKAEYEVLANSTACSDGVNEQYNSRHPPLQEASDKLSRQINEKVRNLQSLRPRLDAAKSSENKLRTQVASLTAQCKNVGDTVSDLDKVRDAISSLSECPGLKRVQFSMPKWIGTWATFDQDAAAQDDDEQDRLMNLACSKIKAGSRAAEVGEIQEQTVEGIPISNTAPNSLMGACPDCGGAEDESFKSNHGRVCWTSGASLTLGERDNNCGAGKKAILCVVDRSDVRQIPGGQF